MRSCLFLCVALVCLCFCGSAFAAFSAPGSLAPGDTFHWVFVTSTTRDATSTDIDVYNTFANDAADTSGQAVTGVAGVSFLGDITWKAIGSTASVHATTNIGTVDSAVYNLANQIVSATGKAGMFAGGGTSSSLTLDRTPSIDFRSTQSKQRTGSRNPALIRIKTYL